jgi:hypothetical protein
MLYIGFRAKFILEARIVTKEFFKLATQIKTNL